MLGPFPIGSIPDIQISRISVIPKKSSPGKWRLITDLSFPHGKSVNDGIDPELTSFKYIKVHQVATQAALFGKGALIAKMDIKEAYHSCERQTPPRHTVAHYLDDFVTAGPPNSDQCSTNQSIIYDVCKELGIPLEIDTQAMELRLPLEKLHNLRDLISEWQFKTVCTRELLGHLNHACSVVKPGRSFIGRLIGLLTDARRKHRHFIRMN